MGMHALNAWQIIMAGGLMMWPIALCSVVAAAIAAEKIAYFGGMHKNSREFLSALLEKMKRHQIKEALELCDKSPSALSNILKAGILKYDRSRPQIKEAIEDASMYEIPKLEKSLDILATIAQIAPLLGFLGTVMGMMKVFYGLQAKSAAGAGILRGELALGIWEALLTTVAGLLVGILSSLGYSYFLSRMNKIVIEIETMATEFVNFLTEQ